MSGKCEGCLARPVCHGVASACPLRKEETEAEKAAAEKYLAGLEATQRGMVEPAIIKALGSRSPSETSMEIYQDEHDVSGLLED